MTWSDLLTLPWQILGWLASKPAKWLGITPDPRLTFGDPFDHAVEENVSFVHLPLRVERQRWKGEVRKVENCGVRIRLRCPGDSLERQGVWESSIPPRFATHITLFEGYATFNVPLIVQYSRRSYWRNDVGAGTYLADLNFMDDARIDIVRLNGDVFFLGVDVIAGARIVASSEWVVAVANTSLSFEHAFASARSLAEVARINFQLRERLDD